LRNASPFCLFYPNHRSQSTRQAAAGVSCVASSESGSFGSRPNAKKTAPQTKQKIAGKRNARDQSVLAAEVSTLWAVSTIVADVSTISTIYNSAARLTRPKPVGGSTDGEKRKSPNSPLGARNFPRRKKTQDATAFVAASLAFSNFGRALISSDATRKSGTETPSKRRSAPLYFNR